MSLVREVLHVWKRVYTKIGYVFTVLVAGFLFYLLNGVILNVQNIDNLYGLLGFFGTLRFLFVSSITFIQRVTTFSAVLTIVLSLLVGMLFSLLFYRYSTVDSKSKEKLGILGGLGVILGVAAPGCVACGVGLLAILGLGSAIASLPFEGGEIIVVATVLVGISVVNISRKLYNPVCKLSFDENKPERR